jgi:hypothetical protein
VRTSVLCWRASSCPNADCSDKGGGPPRPAITRGRAEREAPTESGEFLAIEPNDRRVAYGGSDGELLIAFVPSAGAVVGG